MCTLRKRQSGQAMIETIVAAALVLVPLFLAIPVIAKYQDIRSHVVQGARYAAWERTVWFGGDAAEPMGFGSSKTFSNKWDANEKGDTAIRTEIGKRILSKNTSAFQSGDKTSTGALPGHDLWRDRRGNTLLQDYDDVTGTFSNDGAPGSINDLLTPLMTVTAVVSNFTVDTRAKYTASINLAVRQVAFNGDPLAVTPGYGNAMKENKPNDFLATSNTMAFSEKNAIVANGWSANGPGSLAEYGTHPERITVYNQVRGLTPTSLISPPPGTVFRDVLNVLKTISLVLFPELSTLDLGRIDVDKVPKDRLQ